MREVDQYMGSSIRSAYLRRRTLVAAFLAESFGIQIEIVTVPSQEVTLYQTQMRFYSRHMGGGNMSTHDLMDSVCQIDMTSLELIVSGLDTLSGDR